MYPHDCFVATGAPHVHALSQNDPWFPSFHDSALEQVHKIQIVERSPALVLSDEDLSDALMSASSDSVGCLEGRAEKVPGIPPDQSTEQSPKSTCEASFKKIASRREGLVLDDPTSQAQHPQPLQIEQHARGPFLGEDSLTVIGPQQNRWPYPTGKRVKGQWATVPARPVPRLWQDQPPSFESLDSSKLFRLLRRRRKVLASPYSRADESQSSTESDISRDSRGSLEKEISSPVLTSSTIDLPNADLSNSFSPVYSPPPPRHQSCRLSMLSVDRVRLGPGALYANNGWIEHLRWEVNEEADLPESWMSWSSSEDEDDPPSWRLKNRLRGKIPPTWRRQS